MALASLATASRSLAEELDLARLTENIDLALEATNNPAGELAGNFAFGQFDMNLHHREFMGGMAQPHLYGRPKNNPLVRSSLANTETSVDLAPAATMPLGVSLGLDEWDEGNRNLRLIAHKGLHLPELRLDHRLTMTTSLTADGTESRRSAGRLRLGFDLLGGQQEGVVDYEAAPLARATQFSMNSKWKFGGGGSALLGVTHRPLVEISEARIGYRQPVGGFQMTSDLVGDSLGGYALGLALSLPLGPRADDRSWSLSTLVADLRAEREASAPVESDAFAFQDVN